MALSGGQCEFFSEAWGLAITHPGYSSETFCGAVGGAFACSEMMDDVLTSGAVADLAFAACVRKQGEAKVGYCLKFQNAISEADKSTDLDTLRACYLMEEEAKTVAEEYNDRAVQAFRDKHWQLCYDLSSEAVRLNPTRVAYLGNRAASALKLGQKRHLRQAAEDSVMAYEIDPDHVKSWQRAEIGRSVV